MLQNTASAIATTATSVSPNDNTEVAYHGIYVGTGGIVTVQMRSGPTVIFKNVASGSILPISVIKVFATGTTATDMIGLG